jgi:two-component system, cell cycle sensor histidine kinase and response regulator CckA
MRIQRHWFRLSFTMAIAMATVLLALGLPGVYPQLSGCLGEFRPPGFPALTPALLVLSLAVLVVIYRRMREAEAAEARLRGILDSTSDGIVILDQSGGVLLTNAQLEKMLGKEWWAVLAGSVAKLLPGRDQRTTALASGAPAVRSLDLVGRREDGSEVAVEIRLCSRQITGGPIVTGVIRDLTEPRQAAAALHLRDRAIEAITQGILITDATHVHAPVIYVNPAFETLTGYARPEVFGKGWRLLQGADSRPDALDGAEVAMKEGRSYTAELLCYRKDGSTFWSALSLAPVRSATGAVTHFVVVVTDVSEHKRLEAQLLQAQKMEAIGRLAGGVAHDFNNLLTVIIGHTDLLLHSLSPTDPSRESLEDVGKAADRAAALTGQLLAFSRKQVLAPVVVSLNTLVADLEKMLARLIREDIALTTAFDPDLRAVKVDPAQMGQVLMNLVVNACDAMPHGGKITLRTTNADVSAAGSVERPGLPTGSYALLEVCDTGCGMDDATRERLFEPFFTTKEPGQGTGLGLATVYGIIKQSGGYIYVQTAPGRGTTFRIYLPCTDECLSVVLKRSTLPAASGEAVTILLAEDERCVRDVAGRMLRHAGYTVLEACHGEDALRLGERHPGPIHLLVTDLVMPHLGGSELARRLTGARPDIKVLFISGYSDDAVVRQGALTADVDFLQKPFTPHTLVEKVRKVLDRSTNGVRGRCNRLRPTRSLLGHDGPAEPAGVR